MEPTFPNGDENGGFRYAAPTLLLLEVTSKVARLTDCHMTTSEKGRVGRKALLNGPNRVIGTGLSSA